MTIPPTTKWVRRDGASAPVFRQGTSGPDRPLLGRVSGPARRETGDVSWWRFDAESCETVKLKRS